MKDGGEITKPMVKVDLFMLTEIFTMAIGKMIKLMALVFTVILTVPDMKVTGKKTSNTGKDLKHGLMELATKETM